VSRPSTPARQRPDAPQRQRRRPPVLRRRPRYARDPATVDPRGHEPRLVHRWRRRRRGPLLRRGDPRPQLAGSAPLPGSRRPGRLSDALGGARLRGRGDHGDPEPAALLRPRPVRQPDRADRDPRPVRI
ncbi:MAG: hypothetical protein AVDCRST_MAG59-2398, partial [uncultured Thermomicrobiales bacterium]